MLVGVVVVARDYGSRQKGVDYEAVKDEYADWLMQPVGHRVPDTKKAFAEHHNVHVRVLFQWEKNEEFQRKVRGLKQQLGTAWYGDILNRLKDIVDDTEGKPSDSINAAKTLLGHLDVPDEVKRKDSFELDDEALVAAAKVALGEMGWNVVKNESS